MSYGFVSLSPTLQAVFTSCCAVSQLRLTQPRPLCCVHFLLSLSFVSLSPTLPAVLLHSFVPSSPTLYVVASLLIGMALQRLCAVLPACWLSRS